MRLKSIVIDGFKSYAHRQELSDLDPHFNAITGLNGSGKSNIFDALCFVMGISNLKKVRAEDPRELIFKNGNAGIQRASVTVEFENDNPAAAPPSYPASEYPTLTVSRQILTGGRQKFFFNGKVSEQGRIKQFFHSVSLNVDNPHFLVLQGTVHKLVGMKSSEILGWLEEAAGTRVFDVRRRVAEHLMQSKQKKLDEIHKTMDSEIGPLLLTMKAEQENYTEFLRIVEGLDTKRKFRVAYEYWQALFHLEHFQERLEHLQQSVAGAKEAVLRIPVQRSELMVRLKSLENESQGPREAAVKLHEKAGEIRKEIAKVSGVVKARNAARSSIVKSIQTLEDEKKKNEKRMASFHTNADKLRAQYVQQQEEAVNLEGTIAKLKDSLRLHKSGVRAGLNGVSLEVEKQELESKLICVSGEAERVQAELAEMETEATQLRGLVAKDQHGNADLKLELTKAESALELAQKKYAPFEGNEAQLQKISDEIAEERARYRKLVSEAQSGTSVAPPLEYDAVKGADFETSIHGYLGELITVKDAKHSLALSSALAQHLKKVVIDSDTTVQLLVEKGNLRSRTSFLPLNKVQRSTTITAQQLEAAQAMARRCNGWVSPAIQLVNYQPAYEEVMQRMLNTFVVCSNIKLASELAYDRTTRLRAVTLDGDIAEPSGVMSGGATGGLRDLLSDYAAVAARKAPLEQTRAAIARLEKKFADAQTANENGRAAKEALDAALARVSLLKQRNALSATETYKQQLTELALNREKKLYRAEELKKSKAQLEAASKEVERQMAHRDASQVGKEITERLARAQARHEELTAALRSGALDFERTDEEKSQLEQRAEEIEKELAEKNTELEGWKRDEADLEAQVAALHGKSEEVKGAIQQQDAASNALQAKISEAEGELKHLTEQEEERSKMIKDGEAEIRSSGRCIEENTKKAREIERSQPWVMQEKASFGDPSGSFYFHDQQRTAKTLAELKEHEAISEAMSRKVNSRATVLYDQCKKEYDELLQKREQLMADREVITSTIQQVENRKWESLDLMVQKVSQGFSSLFSTCLAGATCRLVEERNEEHRLTGLQVRVAFNGKEKESLTELSGGQRSLLALCLILAILRFRPAPVYILDEVDAALDPSHTQNMGRMLKQHFADAQFLLVSLKDGMFNSANVVFEVRNTQGYSEITRRTK